MSVPTIYTPANAVVMSEYYCRECRKNEKDPCSHIEEALYQDELVHKAIFGKDEG